MSIYPQSYPSRAKLQDRCHVRSKPSAAYIKRHTQQLQAVRDMLANCQHKNISERRTGATRHHDGFTIERRCTTCGRSVGSVDL